MKKYIFPLLVALSALSLAGAAAFFSITGLSKLFGGAKTEVIIMASALEFAKLVTASFLHRYWKSLKWQIKTYLTIGVVVVMIITSLGIYGFLSNAYSVTSNKLQNIDSQVGLVDQKKTIINSEITRLQENKTLKSNRVQSLVDLRSKQEARVDSLYNRKQTASAKRVELQIEQSTKEISITGIEVDTLNAQIQRKYSEISKLDLEVIDIKNNDVNSEVGPLRYIAKLTGRDMDSVVNFFILLLIFVFDPLAVSLVIATNISLRKELGQDVEGDEKVKFISAEIKEEVKEIEVLEEGKEVVEDAEADSKASSDAIDNYTQEEVVEPIKEEPVKYVADKDGEFKPEVNEEAKKQLTDKILEQLKSQGITHNASYLNFLDVLFENGKSKSGDLLMSYPKLLQEISNAGLVYDKKEVNDFLTICNLLKITDMTSEDKSEYKFAKDYDVSRGIISLLSK
jgi:hypothetical protein